MPSTLMKRSGLYLVFFLILFQSKGVPENMNATLLKMPERVDIYTKIDSVQVIDSTNIFDYMDGAGELYLGYRFDHMEVFEYNAENQPEIVAELYIMETPDDAFGLLSMDWSGNPVLGDILSATPGNKNIAPKARALYGSGLLRLCSGNLYARILAYRETEESQKAVLELGRYMITFRPVTQEPELLSVIPVTTSSGWGIMTNRIGYFRSYLVLNSLFYLSHKNILGLDHSCEALAVPYEKTENQKISDRIQLVFINYETARSAADGLTKFFQAYLPEQEVNVLTEEKEGNILYFNLEDGWLGIRKIKNRTGLVFGCPDQHSAREILNRVFFNKE